VKVSEFEDLSLVQLIVQRGAAAIDELPPALRKNREAAAETIENNVRKLIIDETPINPKYYDRMSALLDALIDQRRQDAISYQEYLTQIVELTRQAKAGPNAGSYPKALDCAAKRALFDNLDKNEGLAIGIDAAVRSSMQDGWRDHVMKSRRVRRAISELLGDNDAQVDRIFDLVKSQNDY
jgi:type I restriction enzyme R subunit